MEKKETILSKIVKFLFDKPLLGVFVITLIIIEVIPALLAPVGRFNEELFLITYILCSLIIYIIFRIKNKDRLPKLDFTKNFLQGMLLTLPVWGLFGVTNFISKVTRNGGINFNAYHLFAIICAALSAGINEELGTRALPIDNIVRAEGEVKNIKRYVILTALIFGAVHIFNVLGGASLSATVGQILYAFGFGVFFAAVYYRTGNILPCIICHFMVDFSGGFDPAYNPETAGRLLLNTEQVPIMKVVTQMMIIALPFALYGLFLIRKKKHDDIVKVWSK